MGVVVRVMVIGRVDIHVKGSVSHLDSALRSTLPGREGLGDGAKGREGIFERRG